MPMFDRITDAIDKLPVGGEDAARQIQIVLESNPTIAAKQRRLRNHGHLLPADAEGGPRSAGRDQ